MYRKMGNLKRVVELEDEVRKLRGELSTVRDELFNRTMLEHIDVQACCSHYTIPIKRAVQMLMDHLGLQIKKTPEKISLEVTNAESLKE